MNLYVARISCLLRLSKKKAGTVLRCSTSAQEFRHAVTANSQAEAIQIIQSTFPWTYYKHVKISWDVIAENV